MLFKPEPGSSKFPPKIRFASYFYHRHAAKIDGLIWGKKEKKSDALHREHECSFLGYVLLFLFYFCFSRSFVTFVLLRTINYLMENFK